MDLHARDMVQILESLGPKVSFNLSPKLVIVGPSLRILGKSAIFSQLLVVML